MERSGHISSDGVRMYERSMAKQHQVVSDVLSGCSGYSGLLKGPNPMWATSSAARSGNEARTKINGEEFVDEYRLIWLISYPATVLKLL